MPKTSQSQADHMMASEEDDQLMSIAHEEIGDQSDNASSPPLFGLNSLPPPEGKLSCDPPLSRAARQIFRRDAAPILLHYFGDDDIDAAWRRQIFSISTVDNPSDASTPSSRRYRGPAAGDVDSKGRRREPLPSVRDPGDSLNDEEWRALLTHAIESRDEGNSGVTPGSFVSSLFCPLHPKYDVLLKHERQSFLMRRRYVSPGSGSINHHFGALSLPHAGRYARNQFLEEDLNHYGGGGSNRLDRGRNAVFLHQCGICGKAFVSRYYLDLHMSKHAMPSLKEGKDATVCPADDLCEIFGGRETCARMAYERMHLHYGRGLLTGSEYSRTGSSFWDFGGDDDNNDLSAKGSGEKKARQADQNALVKEMRRRSRSKSKMILHDLSLDNRDSYGTERVSGGGAFFSPPTACDKGRMAHHRALCRDAIQACFGSNGDGPENDEPPSRARLAYDLEARVCNPLACHHRLHLMAGHVARHVVELTDEWNANHDHSLGIGGWLFLAVLMAFYACVVIGSFGGEEDGGSALLPTKSSGRKNGKRKNKYM